MFGFESTLCCSMRIYVKALKAMCATREAKVNEKSYIRRFEYIAWLKNNLRHAHQNAIIVYVYVHVFTLFIVRPKARISTPHLLYRVA